MIDISLIRTNPELVKENIKKKFQDQKLPLVDEVVNLDKENRSLKQEMDDLRASRNKLSAEVGKLMKEGKKDEAEAIKAKVKAGAEKLADNLTTVMEALIKAKPAAAKGTYIKSVSVSSTMGPGIKVQY